MKQILRIGSLTLTLTFLAITSVMAQVRISGTVTDRDTGEALPGANVVIEGTTLGAATDVDGRYSIPDVPSGNHALSASFIGYETLTKRISVGSSDMTVDFEVAFANQSLEALEIFADRAVDRKTPVAYSNIDKVQIQRELGSRDAPLVLNTTPSVYATAQGGGAGDARINVRGFNQRNVAIMINGVPVNDMENGWVYWSNWDGVGDATSSMQLQRGLSAVNLATPSIGGTMNIITDPSAIGRSASVKQEVGNDGFLKTTAFASTGLINGKYAISAAGVRKTGDGLYRGTWTDSWAYYFAATYNVNSKHRLDFYALGAPQRHGQNLYKQNIAAYDHKYAREVFAKDGLDSSTIDAVFDKFPEAAAGREWNENVSPVSPSYTGKQAAGSKTFNRQNNNFINERENFFHKPQVNLNWYAQFSPTMLLSTVLYYSGGRGGGTGTKGSMVWNYSGPSRVVDYDATIAANGANSDGSKGVLRNSRNNQWTVGLISKLKINVNDATTIETGIDWRTAEIEHFREVRDLLGGSYYKRFDSDFWGSGGKKLGLGDKFDYNNTNTVDWLGAFVQGEYVKDKVSAYGMAGISTIKYSYQDHFTDDGTGKELYLQTDNIPGYQVKGGGLYNVNDQVAVFANAGYVSKVPIFDGAIDDRTGTINKDPKNEKFLSLEAGLNFRSKDRSLAGKINVYSTKWEDRTLTQGVRLQNGDEGVINLLGLNALHQGIEGEVAYQPLPEVRFDGAASIGNWKYTDDVNARYTPDAADPSSQEKFELFIKDLKVGDAPQTQFAFAVTAFPIDGLFAKFTGRAYSKFYSDFDPLGRTDSNDRVQSWEIPSYTVFDLNMGYDLPIKDKRYDVNVFANVFNLFDEIYVQDAVDNSRFNAFRTDGKNHRADDAEVYLGLPRTFNVGTRITLH